MSKELTTISDTELNNVLRNSLFPNASDMSLELVKGYCKAAGLDIMQKPVHIVPMWNSAAGKMVDTIMPGIGLYRINASRTGQYAGISEPVYGPVVTKKVGGVECTYPEWCEITVKRNYGAFTAEFTSHELWLENYAEKGGKEKSVAPNSMWMKRPFGQIKKCAEAQALRMAFPEIGSQPTADEMEGKEIEEKIINPLPESHAEASKLDALKNKVATMSLHELAPEQLRSLDFSGLSEIERKELKHFITKRRRDLKEATVVADIKPTAATDWVQLIENAGTIEELRAIYNSMTPEEKGKYNDAVDFQSNVLKNGWLIRK